MQISGISPVINKFDHAEFTQEECDIIKKRMTELIEKDMEITTVELSHQEALQYFTDTKRPYTCSFLRSKMKQANIYLFSQNRK